MTQLQEAIRRLTAVLRAENAALVAQDYARVGSFVGEKGAALAALNALSSAEAPPAPDPDPGPAEQLGRELKHVVAENRRLLEQAMLVQNRIMSILASAARQAQMPSGYAAKGHRAKSSAASAVALIVRA